MNFFIRNEIMIPSLMLFLYFWSKLEVWKDYKNYKSKIALIDDIDKVIKSTENNIKIWFDDNIFLSLSEIEFLFEYDKKTEKDFKIKTKKEDFYISKRVYKYKDQYLLLKINPFEKRFTTHLFITKNMFDLIRKKHKNK